MEQPNVNNFIEDPQKGVKYNVIAYRKLSQAEIVSQVRQYQTQKKAKKPKKGETIHIITIIGYDS